MVCCGAFALGWRISGDVSGGYSFVVALLVVMCLGAVIARRWREAMYLMSGLRKVDVMSGPEFESYVAAKFRSAGYRVSATRATGDFGVDLIVRKGNARIAIQCKRHGCPVGVAAVQQVVAGAVIHRCTSTMVVSNQEFTLAAVMLARSHNCRLVGRSRLQTLPV